MRNRVVSLLFPIGLVFLAIAVVAAAGAPRRYYRVTFGAPPLIVALACLGGAAYRHGADRRRRLWAGVGACCGLSAAAVLALWVRPSLAGAVRPESRTERAHVLLNLPADRLRAALHAELQPVGLSNCRLERFGEPNDGGYLMCGNLLGSIASGYSYGISGYDQWGCDVARRFNVRVHQYDCFNTTRPVCAGGITVFHPECVGPSRRTDEGGRLFDTLESQLAGNGDGANHVVAKIDVEGAEWDTLLRTPSAVLTRIDQLVVEFHGVGQAHQLAVVRHLKEFFVVAHLHVNNYTCSAQIDPFPGWAYEVLFVNRRIAAVGGAAAISPHPFDAPNDSGIADCQTPTSRWSGPGALASRLFR